MRGDAAGAKVAADRSRARPSRAPSRTAEREHDAHAEARRAAGNLAVGRLLAGHGIHAKLTVSQPGEPEEEEADRVADAVVNRFAAARDPAQVRGMQQRRGAVQGL